MFLNKTIEKNKALVELGFQLHQQEKILPDTYLIDVDTFLDNALKMLKEAQNHNIELYFMLKQVGRNPYLAKELIKLGYSGAVVVDFKEAMIMMKHHIPIANVGHLVQIPKALVQTFVDYNCKYFTVYSKEKIKELNECAKKSEKTLSLLLRVVNDQDVIYSGQTGGFFLNQLQEVIDYVKELSHVKIKGITSFPCFLYDKDQKEIKSTSNLDTLLQARKLLQDNGLKDIHVNAPSSTCTSLLNQMVQYSISSAEPGHGLSGSTPIHAYQDEMEKPCVIYVSEISHHYKGNSYCYGGGYYRRSHVKEALVGNRFEDCNIHEVLNMDPESIDYHFGLAGVSHVSDTVIMAFRFQIFVTRSQVCLLKGLKENKPEIIGIYNSLGEKLYE